MHKYAEIVDRGECYSTSKLMVDGIPANRDEWVKYGFNPEDGMTGELLLVNGCSVLKITEGVYVHMNPRGIREFVQPSEEDDASVYCQSARQALSRMFVRAHPQIESLTMTLRLQHVDRVPYDKVVLRLAEFALADMMQGNYPKRDKEQVAWFIGLWVSAYEKALDGLGFRSFEETFTSIYQTYFSLL